jgi:hypothetical protein
MRLRSKNQSRVEKRKELISTSSVGLSERDLASARDIAHGTSKHSCGNKMKQKNVAESSKEKDPSASGCAGRRENFFGLGCVFLIRKRTCE